MGLAVAVLMLCSPAFAEAGAELDWVALWPPIVGLVTMAVLGLFTLARSE